MKFKDYILKPNIERSIIFMALLAIIESLQLLIIVMLIFSFIPILPTDFAKDLFPDNKTGLNPNRKMFFLHVWAGAGLLIHMMGLWLFRRGLGEAKTESLMGRLIMVDGCWLLLQVFAVFKMVVYPQAAWVKPVFYIILGLSLLSRFFWTEINTFLLKADEILPRWSSQLSLRVGMDVFIALFLVLGLWIFDQQRLWALIDLGGNRALAEDGWRSLSPLIKGISYQSALPWLMGLSLMYYGFFYLLLRGLFGNILLAGCGVFLAVKWQYFHNGITPIIWQFPLKTIVPLLPDVFFWLCLLMHTRQKRAIGCLTLAGVVLGAYLAYHFTTGIWLWFGWAAYLVLLKARPAWYFLPWAIGLALWFVFYGPLGAIGLINQNWSAMGQVLQGIDGLPYYDCLKGRNFFVFSVQFIIPIIYFVTIVAIKQKEAKALMIPISIYGLGLFTAHVWQPSLSNFDSVSGPLVIVLCFWAVQALAQLSLTRRTIISSLFLIVYAGALLTNNLFGIYPNVWNVSGVNWAQVKAIYQERMTGR